VEEELRAREDSRTGEGSREETAEFVADAGVEAVRRLGESLGTCDMG
jgi:cation transport regulator ChaB